MSEKARYWQGVCYPENMVDDWEESIGDILGVPYAYCIHDKDVDEEGNIRKEHVHILTAFTNTTTHNHALKCLDRLSKTGTSCISTIESCISVRGSYNYLIHDTETCRKKGKYQYPADARHTGNNFDIGAYEQVSVSDKRAKVTELSRIILDKQFTNYADFYEYVLTLNDAMADEVILSYSSHLERLCKGCYQRQSNEAKRIQREVVKQTFETNQSILQQMSENQRMASIREAQALAMMGLDPITGEVIDGLPF